MHSIRRRCLCSIWAAVLAVSTVQAQPAHADAASLYRAFGEKPGLQRLMDDFVPRLMQDPRLAAHFEKTSARHLKTQLVDQFCQLSGGPCVLDGPDMKEAHAELAIRKSDFNAMVELLQQSMDAQGIAFRAQNRMLALLAPMHRDIVNLR